MFLIYGPNTNGGTGSVIYVIEAAVAHVIAALDAMRVSGASRIEVGREVEEAFNRELRTALAGTVWHTGCESWYLDENGNDPNQWPWLWSTYRRRTAQIGRASTASPAPRPNRRRWPELPSRRDGRQPAAARSAAQTVEIVAARPP